MRFRDEVRIWILAEDMDVKHCVATRLISNLHASARRATIGMDEKELLPTKGADGAPLDKAGANKLGVRNDMEKLEADLGQQKPERKGDTLHEFFATNHYIHPQAR